MAFWKKVAGAFVEFDEAPPPASNDPEAAKLQEEADRLLRELHGAAASPGKATRPHPAQPAPGSRGAAAPAAPSALSGSAAPARSFSEIYAQAGVGTTAYSAEQLLAVLERLRAMPREQILVAVDAMDAADDRWNIADVLQDAQRKQHALQQAIDTLDAHARASLEAGRAARERLDAQVKEAEAEVNRQIEALRSQLADVQRSALDERATIDREEAEARGLAEGERGRLSDEMKRLRYVLQFFQEAAPSPPVR
jgi:hypothetical protein